MKNNALKTRSWAATQNYPTYPAEPPPAPKRSLGGKLLRGLLLFFFGTWMFALGVIVGRETAPIDFEINPLAEEFYARKAEEMAEERELLERGVETLQEAELDFHKELQNSASETREPILPLVNPANPLKPNQIETKRPVAKKPAVAKKIEPPAHPPTKPDPPPRPAPEPPPKAVGGETGEFAIQVASYGNPMDAERLVDRLRGNGYPSAYQSNEEVPGIGMRFRVKVGYFTSKSSAEGVLSRLVQEENLIDAYIFHRK
jgi:cell division septation protein DedD